MYSLWNALRPTCARFLLVLAIGAPAIITENPYLDNPSRMSGLLDASENTTGCNTAFLSNFMPRTRSLLRCIHFTMCIAAVHASLVGFANSEPSWLHPLWHSGKTPRVAHSSCLTTGMYPLSRTFWVSAGSTVWFFVKVKFCGKGVDGLWVGLIKSFHPSYTPSSPPPLSQIQSVATGRDAIGSAAGAARGRRYFYMNGRGGRSRCPECPKPIPGWPGIPQVEKRADGGVY